MALIAFLADGDATVGAGHVGRCLPLAAAFERAGHDIVFAGCFGGLAGGLLDHAGVAQEETVPEAADALVTDTYTDDVDTLRALVAQLPTAIMGESRRVPGVGTVIDYHFGARAADDRLAGPAYAPIDPAFKEGRRDRTGPVGRVLLSLGGSAIARDLLPTVEPAVQAVFPDAEVFVAGRDAYTPLADTVRGMDVAVAGAGVTAYELACAGVPAVLVGLAANQAPVVSGAQAAGVALTARPDAGEIAEQLTRLQDAGERRRLQKTGPAVVDGDGAQRAAAALLARWTI